MAIMWPNKLPEWVLMDSRRAAERKVYNKLQEILDDEWKVYYSRPWYGISRSGGEIEGEADFILVHANLGLLFIEVKGGQISYDPTSSNWYSTDRNKIKHKIKDPVEQAKKCRYQFAEKLKRTPGWPSTFIRYRYGVVFTDTIKPSASLSAIGGHDANLFCHGNIFEFDLENWVRGRLEQENQNTNEVGPGETGLRIFHTMVADPVTLRTTISSEVSDEISTMDNLFSGAQMAIVNQLQQVNRAVVTGGAGTGKTLLAIEIAHKFARERIETLILTCSKPLAIDIKSRFPKELNVTVTTVSEYFAEYGLNKKWDAILIDEAQDVDWALWEKIESLSITNDAKFYVFMDSNQAIYRLSDDLSTRLNAKNLELNLNLRNTKKIAEATEPLYRGPLIAAAGPNGTIPKIVRLNKFDQSLLKSAEIILELKEKEGVKLSDITVLLRDKESRDRAMFYFTKMGMLNTDASKRNIGFLTVETVPLFKGLESPIVIAICDSEFANSPEMSYVTISRARTLFFLLGSVEGSLFEDAISGVTQ